MSKAKLHILPIPISESDPHLVLPATVLKTVPELKYYIVENVRTARRFLKKVDRNIDIDELTFFEIDKHGNNDLASMLQPIAAGNDIGLLSESGLPTVADPGSMVVAKAHENQIETIVHVGPSSIVLAIAGSGLNGQCFSFEGYLPKGESERKSKLGHLEERSRKERRAISLIETPYRNDHMLATMLKSLNPGTNLCIAIDLTGEDQSIQTKSIKEWKQKTPSIGKVPCVFVFQA